MFVVTVFLSNDLVEGIMCVCVDNNVVIVLFISFFVVTVFLSKEGFMCVCVCVDVCVCVCV